MRVQIVTRDKDGFISRFHDTIWPDGRRSGICKEFLQLYWQYFSPPAVLYITNSRPKRPYIKVMYSRGKFNGHAGGTFGATFEITLRPKNGDIYYASICLPDGNWVAPSGNNFCIRVASCDTP